MAYVRKKRVNGYEYYQLVESYREDGRVRQRMLEHLGEYPTVEAAIEGLSSLLREYRRITFMYENYADRLLRSYQQQNPWYRGPVRRMPKTYKGPHSAFIKHYWREIDSALDAQRRGIACKEKRERLVKLMESGKVKRTPGR